VPIAGERFKLFAILAIPCLLIWRHRGGQVDGAQP